MILFLLCMKFTSLPFTRGLQGKHSQTYHRAILFSVAAPLQNLPSLSRVAMCPWDSKSPVSQALFPYPRTPAEYLTKLSVWSILLQSPAPGRRQGDNALNCPVEDPFSLSLIQDTWKTDMVGSLKSVNRDPTHSLHSRFCKILFF